MKHTAVSTWFFGPLLLLGLVLAGFGVFARSPQAMTPSRQHGMAAEPGYPALDRLLARHLARAGYHQPAPTD